MRVSQPVRVAETDVFVGDERGNVIFQDVAVASWSTLKGGCHDYDARRRRRRKDKLCQENAEIDVMQPNSSLLKIEQKNDRAETKKRSDKKRTLGSRKKTSILYLSTMSYSKLSSINKLFKSTIYVILANHPYKIYCNTLLSSQQSLSRGEPARNDFQDVRIEQSWTTVCTGRRQPCRLPCIETLEKYARQCWSVSFRISGTF